MSYISYGRSKCNATVHPGRPYLEFETQRCYDACPIGKYHNSTNTCLLCTKCTAILSCSLCYQNGCPAAATTYFKTSATPYSCVSCSTGILHCQTCAASSSGVMCTLCDAGYVVSSGGCSPCSTESYYNATSLSCPACNSTLPGCERCSANAANCVLCYANTLTEVVGGACQPCNPSSYYEPSARRCYSCTSAVANCLTCSYGSSVQCSSCDPSTSTYLNSNACVACSQTQYYNATSLSCPACNSTLPGCERCSASTDCTQCDPALNVTLVDRQCLNNSDLVQCVMSVYDESTGSCEAISALQGFTDVVAFTASLPIISLFPQVFFQLIQQFNMLSYYCYHKRNYSRVIEVYLEAMNSIADSRFIPAPLEGVYATLDMSYRDDILSNDLGRSPPKFASLDGDVYFLKTTQDLWVSSLPISLVCFVLFALLHALISRHCRSRFLKRYQYAGMVALDVFGCNVDYYSFKCFSQLHQTVPLGRQYYCNLASCFLFLLLLVLYSASYMGVFRFLYEKVDGDYLAQELFAEVSPGVFACFNVAQLFIGFSHAFLVDYPVVQSVLLFATYTFRVAVCALIVGRAKSKVELTFRALGYLVMVVLQGFFLAELFLLGRGLYTHGA